MSLFINNDKHLKVYKSDVEVMAPNQDVFKQDTVLEIIEAQQEANNALHRSIQELEASYVKQMNIQSRKMTNMRHNIKLLSDRQIGRQEIENDVASLLEKYNGENEALLLKIEEQIADQTSKQEAFQHEAINRLDKQEALTEKMLRKMDHFRSVLYERTHFLTEKIEQSYHSTSAYLHKVLRVRKTPTIPQEIRKSID